METLRTIRLYGNLSRFGRVHRLAVQSTAEAIRALCALLPGFERELMTSRDRGITYACFLGKRNIGKDELTLSGGSEDIRIAPIMAGAKAGVLQTIIGITLIVAGVYTGNATLIQMGASMTIGGVMQMLSPQQQKLSTGDSPENGASYNFNGPVNTQAQGNPVPLLYGRMIVGSAVISAGILAQDQAYAGAPLDRPLPLKMYDALFGA
jgi:predicted phage tail protein